MMLVKQCVFTAVLLIVASAVSGYTLPANLKTFYNQHKSQACGKTLKGGFSSAGDGSGNTLYCGDVSGVIYLHSSGGQYADMDIDCDGANRHAGKCGNDPSGQDITAFQDTVASYKKGISDLDANLHPYVVFGNEGGNPSFDPQSAGMKPLSVMAVVCGGNLFYGIWGDTNGATSTGESSLAMGNLCFPKENLSGDNGHEPRDVLYLGFTGTAAVPGANGAKWNAGSTQEFEDSIKALGDKLVAKLTAVNADDKTEALDI